MFQTILKIRFDFKTFYLRPARTCVPDCTSLQCFIVMSWSSKAWATVAIEFWNHWLSRKYLPEGAIQLLQSDARVSLNEHHGLFVQLEFPTPSNWISVDTPRRDVSLEYTVLCNCVSSQLIWDWYRSHAPTQICRTQWYVFRAGLKLLNKNK